MRFALFFETYNRVSYLQQALHSWEHVEGLENWHLQFSMEPGSFQQQMFEELTEFQLRVQHPDCSFTTNATRLGVAEHPYSGFERMFQQNYDFVVIVEDDCVVSRDILLYFEAAATFFRSNPKVAGVCGVNKEQGLQSNVIELTDRFCPQIWGTWAPRWRAILEPTWDHGYNTYNGEPGNQAGWDWNINTRIMPAQNLVVATPGRTRVQNIGVYGTHSNESNFEQYPDFDIDRNDTEFYW